MEIKFNQPTEYESKGRNRFIQTTGVGITRIGNDLFFEPINSRGKVSDSCRVVVAFSAIDQVIEALTSLR